jgi:hypothetical protein
MNKKHTLSILKTQKSLSLSILCVLLISCKDDHTSQPPEKQLCEKDATLVLSRLTTVTFPPPSGWGTDSVKCPQFNFWERPFHIGDSLAIIVSQNFGAQIIGNKPVYVTISSNLGDTETFFLRSGFWPCETRAVDVEIYRAIIIYSSTPCGGPPYPYPNNGQLEIRATGDTLSASYISYCSGDTLRDSVAIIPR